MLVARNLSLQFLDQIIFDKLNLSVSYDQKIGILGRNGSGKSTLLRVISGLQELDGGTVNFDKKKKIAYLPQESVMHATCSAYEQVLTGFGDLFAIKKEAEELERILTGTDNLLHAAALVERYQAIQEQLEYVDFAKLYAKAEEVLCGLGFNEERWNQSVRSLSIGWQMRVMLAQLLLQEADFYLFDEPTNHLDLPTKEWFVAYLKQANWGYFLVTHDRYFLDYACERIVELARGQAKMYHGNFSLYLHEKEAEQERLRSMRAQQEKEIERKQRTIDRFRASASKAAMVQNMIKEVESIELVEVEPPLPTVHFSFPHAERAGKIVLEGHAISFAYGSKQIFKNVSFQVMRGQKVALIAPNGIGKTTLFTIIAGLLPCRYGSYAYGHNVKSAYFQQDQTRVLGANNTIFDEVKNACPTSTEQTIRTFLGSFLFTGDDVHKKIKVLSGGEKNRVAMVKVLLQGANLLLLDEPTNHLDIYAKDILVQALQQYDGTLVFVSHDHDVVTRVATIVHELTPDGLIVFEGPYEDYLYYKQQHRKQVLELQQLENQQQPSIASSNRAEQKQQRIQMREVEKAMAALEHERDKLGLKLGGLEYRAPEYQAVLKKLQQVEQDLENIVTRWEYLMREM